VTANIEEVLSLFQRLTTLDMSYILSLKLAIGEFKTFLNQKKRGISGPEPLPRLLRWKIACTLVRMWASC
jgi:hypothetical protein